MEHVDVVERFVQGGHVQERLHVAEPHTRRHEVRDGLAAHHAVQGGPPARRAVREREAVPEPDAERDVL